MLKYIGDFEKLKDYGLEKRFYGVELIYSKPLVDCHTYIVVMNNGLVTILERNIYESLHIERKCIDTLEMFETLYDLIKDGLVIKEVK